MFFSLIFFFLFFLNFFLFYFLLFESLFNLILKNKKKYKYWIRIFTFLKNFWFTSFLSNCITFILNYDIFVEIFREFKFITRLFFELFFEILFFFFFFFFFLFFLRIYISGLQKYAYLCNTFVWPYNRLIKVHKEPIVRDISVPRQFYDAELFDFVTASQIIYVYLKFQFLRGWLHRSKYFILYLLFYWPVYILDYILISNSFLFLVHSLIFPFVAFFLYFPVFWISKYFWGLLHWARTQFYFAMHVEDILLLWRNITFFKYVTYTSNHCMVIHFHLQIYLYDL